MRSLLLLVVGLLLIGVAWGLRSSRWARENALRTKDLPALEAAARQNPDDFLTQYYLAKAFYTQRRYSEARTAYEAAVRLESGAARAHLGLALSLYEMGLIREAKGEFLRTLDLDKNSAWAEYMIGKIAWHEGEVEESLRRVKRAAELDPRSDQAWYGLGVCYIRLMRYPEALQAMQQAAARNEANPSYHTAIGELQAMRGNFGEAQQRYARALQLKPDYGPASALMGSLYLKKKDGDAAANLARAEELLLRAQNLPTYQPQNVYRDLGELYLRKAGREADSANQAKRKKQAAAALEEGVRKAPYDERTYYALSRAYRALGDPRAEQAMKQFRFLSDRRVQRASLRARVGQHPNDATANLELARVYRDLGMARRSLYYYFTYLRLSPDSAPVAAEIEEYRRQLAQAQAAGLSQDFQASPQP